MNILGFDTGLNKTYLTLKTDNKMFPKIIESTEEKVVHCGLSKMPVLILLPKKGIDYKYNFLQKHNSGFTAFSIPLYDVISDKDREELVNLIKQKVK